MFEPQIVTVKQNIWGTTPTGQESKLFHLQNETLSVTLSDHGARIVKIQTPDRDDRIEDVVLGFDALDDYIRDLSYMGATVGRFANRIAEGSFLLDEKAFQITRHSGSRHALHGGAEGFDRRIWNTSILPKGLLMQLTSPDGDMGFPGNLNVTVRYLLLDTTLQIDFEATTDRPTILNLTNHAYFNLTGKDRGNILDHQVTIFSDAITAIDADAIPTGEILSVNGTPFDLRHPKRIGTSIAEDHPQMLIGDGFNHNYVLPQSTSRLHPAAEVMEPFSGRTLTVSTTEPGLQFYTGNALDGSIGRHGRAYTRRTGFCLETQHFPDSPHHPHFPSTVLQPEERFCSTTAFTFGIATTI